MTLLTCLSTCFHSASQTARSYFSARARARISDVAQPIVQANVSFRAPAPLPPASWIHPPPALSTEALLPDPLASSSDTLAVPVESDSSETPELVRLFGLRAEETALLGEILYRWPWGGAVNPAAILAWDLFHSLKYEPGLQEALKRFAVKWKEHDILLSPSGQQDGQWVYALNESASRNMRELFAKHLGNFSAEARGVLKDRFDAIEPKIALWRKLLAQPQYGPLFLTEELTRCNEPPPYKTSRAQILTLATWMQMAYGDLQPLFLGVDFSPLRTLQNRKDLKKLSRPCLKQLREMTLKSQTHLSLLSRSRVPPAKLFAYTRFHYYCQHLTNVYEDRVFGQAKINHLLWLKQHLVDYMAEYVPKEEYGLVYSVLRKTDGEFRKNVQEVLDLIEDRGEPFQLATLRLHASRLEFPMKKEQFAELFQATYRAGMQIAAQINPEDRERREACNQVYRCCALEMSRFYLLAALLEKLKEGAFTDNPYDLLPPSFLNMLSLEPNEESDEEPSPLPESSSSSEDEKFDVEIKEEEAKRPHPKIKTRGVPYPAPAPTPSESTSFPELPAPEPLRLRNVRHRKLVQLMRDKKFFPSARSSGGSHRTYANASRKTSLSGHHGGAIYAPKTLKKILRATNSLSDSKGGIFR